MFIAIKVRIIYLELLISSVASPNAELGGGPFMLVYIIVCIVTIITIIAVKIKNRMETK